MPLVNPTAMRAGGANGIEGRRGALFAIFFHLLLLTTLFHRSNLIKEASELGLHPFKLPVLKASIQANAAAQTHLHCGISDVYLIDYCVTDASSSRPIPRQPAKIGDERCAKVAVGDER